MNHCPDVVVFCKSHGQNRKRRYVEMRLSGPWAETEINTDSCGNHSYTQMCRV